jgi:hypothetical protein
MPETTPGFSTPNQRIASIYLTATKTDPLTSTFVSSQESRKQAPTHESVSAGTSKPSGPAVTKTPLTEVSDRIYSFDLNVSAARPYIENRI